MRGVGRSTCRPRVAKSMRKRLVGGFARLLRSIPVERTQTRLKGAGTVWLSPEDGVSLQGGTLQLAAARGRHGAVGGRVGQWARSSRTSGAPCAASSSRRRRLCALRCCRTSTRARCSRRCTRRLTRARRCLPRGRLARPRLAAAAQGGHRHHGPRRDHAAPRAAAAARGRRPQLLGAPLPLARLPRHRRALLGAARAGGALRVGRHRQARGDLAADGAGAGPARRRHHLGARLRHAGVLLDAAPPTYRGRLGRARQMALGQQLAFVRKFQEGQ